MILRNWPKLLKFLSGIKTILMLPNILKARSLVLNEIDYIQFFLSKSFTHTLDLSDRLLKERNRPMDTIPRKRIFLDSSLAKYSRLRDIYKVMRSKIPLFSHNSC